MGRFKSNKEYAIRITHPELGSFYFNYENYQKFIFTTDLSKVRKWKTLKIANDQVDRILKFTNYRNSGMTIFNCDNLIIPDHLKNNVVTERKRKIYKVRHLISKDRIVEIENAMDELYLALKVQLKEINNLFENDTFKDLQYNDDVKNNFNNFTKNIAKYKQKQKIHIRHLNDKYEKVYIDIVDASFNFRVLKIKKLQGENVSV